MTVLAKLFGNRQGFTLVELMAIVAILSILAAIAIPNFTGVTESADKQAARGDLKRSWSGAKANVVGIPNMQSAGSYIRGDGISVDGVRTSINQLVIVKSFSGGVCEMTIPNDGQDPSFGRDC